MRRDQDSLSVYSWILFIIKQPHQLAGSRSTTVAISSSVYILKPFSRVTLASCTFLASSFSSMTCFNVLRTRVSASVRVKDYGRSVSWSQFSCAGSRREPTLWYSF